MSNTCCWKPCPRNSGKVKDLQILLCCDTDPDRERFGAPAHRGTSPLCWRGVKVGIERLLEATSALRDSVGTSPRFMFCLRADEQVRRTHGATAWCFDYFKEQMATWRDRGHEIGWHHHHWRLDEETGQWYQEQGDADWMGAHLERSHRELREAGLEVSSIKTGWCAMDNATMNGLRKLGIRAELSGMPGQSYHPAPDHDGYYFGSYDWSRTGQEMYRPSPADYQAAAEEGGMWEIPISAGRSGWLSQAESMALALRRRQWPQRPGGSRPVSFKLTFHPRLFRALWQGFAAGLESLERPYFHAYFHPDELLPDLPAPTRWIYSADNARRNLEFLLERLERAGYRSNFLTAEDLSRRLSP